MVFAYYIILFLLFFNTTAVKQNDLLFSTPAPLPRNLRTIVPKDAEEFAKQPTKDEYQIQPSNQEELGRMLAYSDNYLTGLNTDVVNMTSQQFEEIKKKHEEQSQKEKLKDPKILRTGDLKVRNAMDRAAALMTQFVYGARYKLQYSQQLRSRYAQYSDYKIGYAFALIRDIKQQQLTLYSAMSFNYNRHLNRELTYAAFNSYVQVYEKILRLDIDMYDVIAHVKILEVERIVAKEKREKEKAEKKKAEKEKAEKEKAEKEKAEKEKAAKEKQNAGGRQPAKDFHDDGGDNYDDDEDYEDDGGGY